MARLLLVIYLAAVAGLAGVAALSPATQDVPPVWLAVWGAELLVLAVAPRWPLAAVLAYLAMSYGVSSHGSLHDTLLSLRVLDGVAALGLAAWVLWRRSPAAAGLRFVAMPRLAMALWAWIALCAALAVAGGQALGPFLRHHPALFFHAAVLAGIVADTLRSPRQMTLLSGLLAGIVLLRAMLQAPAGIHLESYLATLAVVCLPLAGVMATLNRGAGGRVLSGLLATTLAAVVVIGQNRAATVALAAMVLAWALQGLWQARWRRGALVALPMLLGAAGLWLAYSEQAARFRSLWDAQAHAGASLDRGTAAERLALWRAGWDMAVDHPLFGVGPGNYVAQLAAYRPGMDPLSAHSNYVQMLAETGFVGLLLYLACFGTMLVALGRAASTDGPLAGTARLLQLSLLAYLVGGVFNSRADFVLAYVVLGWATALLAASALPGSSSRLAAGPTAPHARERREPPR